MQYEKEGFMRYALYKHNRALALLAAGAFLSTSLLFIAPTSSATVRSHAGNYSKLSITSAPWGTANGSSVQLFTLSNSNGMTVNISNYGGVVQSIWVRDRTGRPVNVALGFPTLSDYVNDFQNQPWPVSGGSGDTYFGAIIGRYANRIAGASFTLNGTTYTLPANNGPNTLHGGPLSYNTQVWAATPETGPGFVALKLTYTDPAGYNGFPAAVANTVTYTLTNDNALKIDYLSTNLDSTLSTVINLTNHTYFNLAGEGSGNVLGQYLQINADTYTPVDGNLIPTGAFVPVAGTAFDFRTMKPIGRDIERADLPDGGGQPLPQLVIAHGYDHNWVLNGSGYRLAAIAMDPGNGVVLWTYTDQPGVQFYSGNFLVGDLQGTSGHTYRQTDGFTLETQHFPDSPHHIGQAGWPSVVLGPGQTFTSTTTYKLGVEGFGFVHRSMNP
jgi:aldose 1-epimerase